MITNKIGLDGIFFLRVSCEFPKDGGRYESAKESCWSYWVDYADFLERCTWSRRKCLLAMDFVLHIQQQILYYCHSILDFCNFQHMSQATIQSHLILTPETFGAHVALLYDMMRQKTSLTISVSIPTAKDSLLDKKLQQAKKEYAEWKTRTLATYEE